MHRHVTVMVMASRVAGQRDVAYAAVGGGPRGMAGADRSTDRCTRQLISSRRQLTELA